MHKLFAIPARVEIGRAKSVPSDEYEQVYAKIAADMDRSRSKRLSPEVRSSD